MKAEELMIGDYIKHGFGGIGKVTELSKGIVTVYDKGLDDGEGNCEVNFAENEIQPIPLTPEILEKNGFEVDEKNENMLKWRWSVIDDCISYDKSTGIVRIFYPSGLVFVKILEFVHELQHALRLCNIDKKIEGGKR